MYDYFIKYVCIPLSRAYSFLCKATTSLTVLLILVVGGMAVGATHIFGCPLPHFIGIPLFAFGLGRFGWLFINRETFIEVTILRQIQNDMELAKKDAEEKKVLEVKEKNKFNRNDIVDME